MIILIRFGTIQAGQNMPALMKNINQYKNLLFSIILIKNF